MYELDNKYECVRGANSILEHIKTADSIIAEIDRARSEAVDYRDELVRKLNRNNELIMKFEESGEWNFWQLCTTGLHGTNAIGHFKRQLKTLQYNISKLIKRL